MVKNIEGKKSEYSTTYMILYFLYGKKNIVHRKFQYSTIYKRLYSLFGKSIRKEDTKN